jgi:hypothetical protein
MEVDRRTRPTRRCHPTTTTIKPRSQLSHTCTIVVIIDKRKHGFYVTMLISRRTAEQSEDRTWRTYAPRLDPWYMFPMKSSQLGRPNTPLTCITALPTCPHETLPRAPTLSKVNAGKESKVTNPMLDCRGTGRIDVRRTKRGFSGMAKKRP